MNNESSMDQAFLEELTKAVEQNIGKEKFGVKELAHEAGMSQSKIYRKIALIDRPTRFPGPGLHRGIIRPAMELRHLPMLSTRHRLPHK